MRWMIKFCGVLLGMIFCGIGAWGQQVYNFDNDVVAVRNQYVVNYDFRDKAADYIQYSPIVLVSALKAFGYESRSSWGELGVSSAFSVAIMAALVNGTKYSVQRLRPDGSNHHSFVSGHTATAFTLAAILDREFRDQSPWWGIGGYAIATYVGASRVWSNKHYATDVAAGALVGLGATPVTISVT